MEPAYILFVCMGISGWGCGAWDNTPPMPKADCFEILSTMRFDTDAPGDTRRSTVAYCKPISTEKPEPSK